MQEPSLSLAFDYAEHDLYEMLRFHRERGMGPVLEAYTLKSLMWQLLDGLHYLHSNWIMHRCLLTPPLSVRQRQGHMKLFNEVSVEHNVGSYLIVAAGI